MQHRVELRDGPLGFGQAVLSNGPGTCKVIQLLSPQIHLAPRERTLLDVDGVIVTATYFAGGICRLSLETGRPAGILIEVE